MKILEHSWHPECYLVCQGGWFLIFFLLTYLHTVQHIGLSKRKSNYKNYFLIFTGDRVSSLKHFLDGQIARFLGKRIFLGSVST